MTTFKKLFTVKRDPYRSDPQLNDIENAVESSDGQHFYVNPHHPDASDGNDGIFSELPLLTVTKAVANASAYNHDVINVQAQNSWQYGSHTETGISETVIIPAAKPGLTLRGVGHGAPGTYWSPHAAIDTILTIEALDTVVENFCFWKGNILASVARGILINWAAPGALGENIIVRNCTFDTSVDMGIQLIFAYYCKIQKCIFDRCDNFGIYLDPASSPTEYLEISDSWFNNCGAAMSLAELARSRIFGNNIFNATAKAGGAAANLGIHTVGGSHNQVYDNYFSCLLPVPANGDWNDFNTAAATDAWINNHCLNGDATANPT